MKIKLGGFHFAGTDPLTSFFGSPWHIAPEISRGGATYANAVDVWSIGITIFQYSLFGRFFVGLSDWAQNRPKTTQVSRPGWQSLTELANTMLICDPNLRPSATECLSELGWTESRVETDQYGLNLSFLRKHKTTSLLQWVRVDISRDPPIAINAIEVCKIFGLSYQKMVTVLGHANRKANYRVSNDIYISPNDMATLLNYSGNDAVTLTNALSLKTLQKDIQGVHLATMSRSVYFNPKG